MKKSAIFIALVAFSTVAFAHNGATGITKERMDGMGSLAKSMKALAQMVKTDDTDLERAAEIGREIQAHSGSSMNKRFPSGQQQMVSEASPAVWEDWERFEQISDDLFQAAARLETGAMSGSVDLNSAVRELGATCSSCHKDFRVKK